MSDLQEKCAVVLQALNDWAVNYAPDMCDDDTVAQAKSRILEHGTLAYIADASEKMREVIAALSEADQRVKDARQIAIIDAAKTAILAVNHLSILPPSVRKFPEVGGIVASKILALDPTIDLVNPVHNPHVEYEESGDQ